MTDKPIDPKKPVQLRCGTPAKILCDDLDNPKPIVARVKWPSGGEDAVSFHHDGVIRSDGRTSPNDLVNIPEIRKVWVVVYLFVSNESSASVTFEREDEALGFIAAQLKEDYPYAIKCVEIEV
ncbi:MAG: hypothetical protein EA420_16415 [Candidatus Competibacteraceae bacterium]|nr:MAG: hypothetical protein EA420_16415 [Candidatus Competibacteraceae bacterium]